MKFAKTLQQVVATSDPEWAPLFMNYKYLKKRIKAIKIYSAISRKTAIQNAVEEPPLTISCSTRRSNCDGQEISQKKSIAESTGERDFFIALHAELRKSSEFFKIAEQQMGIRFARIKEGARQLRETMTVTRDDLNQLVMAACLKLYKDLLMLENYAVMNFCGFSKILKKHDKNTGFVTRDQFMKKTMSHHQHLCKYETLKGIIKETEQLFIEISQMRHIKISLQANERISIESIMTLKSQAIWFQNSECDGDERDHDEAPKHGPSQRAPFENNSDDVQIEPPHCEQASSRTDCAEHMKRSPDTALNTEHKEIKLAAAADAPGYMVKRPDADGLDSKKRRLE